MARELRNPATGRVVGTYEEHSEAEFAAMVAEARGAQPAWAAVPPRKRGKVLRRMGRELFLMADEACLAMSRCTGKSFMDAYAGELLPGALCLRHYARIAPRVLRPRKIRRSSLFFYNKSSTLYREPWGVVGVISPWNYSLGIPVHEVGMALAAGNAVILKVASQAEPVGNVIAEAARRAGLPAGLLQVVRMPGAVAGRTFIESGIGKLFFTGSVGTGKELMRLAAERLLPLSLELGGADPMIVLKDANLRRAAYGVAWAGMSNAGQSCGGVQRVYVERPAYEAFKAELLTAVRGLRFGYAEGADCSIEVGTVATEEQRKAVEAQVADALGKGAKAILSHPEELPAGNFHRAVVLEGVRPGMRLWSEECFGPVVSLESFDTEAEAVARANDSPLGLSASVWTRDGRKAGRIAAALEAGAVSLNDHLMSHGMAETPWGGRKLSGIGRTHGALGLEEMTQPKVVVRDLFPGIDKDLFWHPYTEKGRKALDAAYRLLYGPRRGAKPLALLSLFVSRLGKKG